MMRFRLALAAALAATAIGCHRPTLGPPSADFKAANAKYVAMLDADGPVDVFTDPDISEVQALLAKVPADSVDIEAARRLQKTIADGQAEASKVAEAREAAQAAAAKPLDVVVPTGGGTATIEPSSEASAAAPSAAVPNGPTPGMSAADFRAKYGACFLKNSAFTDDKGNHGEAFALAPSCQAKYPGLANDLVLLSGDKVLSMVPKSAMTSQQQVTLTQTQNKPAPKQVAQAAAPQPAAPPPPQNPNTIDQKVAAPASKLQVAPNLNSDLDARTKLPGQP